MNRACIFWLGFRLGLVLLFLPRILTATPPSGSRSDAIEVSEEFEIDAILIEGLFRTQTRIVLRELGFGEGEIVTISTVEESMQRLRNLEIFRVVDYALLDKRVPLLGEQNNPIVKHRILEITIDERWTLLPFGSLSRGGGAFSFATGFMDKNLFGAYISGTIQYTRFSGTNSFALSLGDPRFWGEKIYLGGAISQTNLLRFSYDKNAKISDGWKIQRKAANFTLGYEWIEGVTSAVNISYANDRFSDHLVPQEIANMNPGVPSNTRRLIFDASLSLGTINSRRFLRSGIRYFQNIRLIHRKLGSDLNLIGTNGVLHAYAILPFDINLAGRVGVGFQSLDNSTYAYHLGGLSEVRGFFYRRFSGPRYWFSNAEIRFPIMDNPYVAIQNIGFIDALRTGSKDRSLFGVEAASAGIGLRIIVPKIHRLVMRFDYAFPLKGTGHSSFSFGSQQFF